VQLDYDICLERLLTHEGGYTNDAEDPGGPTNYGITIYDARKYGAEFGWTSSPTIQDMRTMPLSFAKHVYDEKYWHSQRCNELPPGVDDTVFDYGVNSGIARSGKVLRRVIGMSDRSWRVDDEVLHEVGKRDPVRIVDAINDERLRFLQQLKTWPKFGKGWGRRVAEVKAYDEWLAKRAQLQPRPTPVPSISSPTDAKAAGFVSAPPRSIADVAVKEGGVGSIGLIGVSTWIGNHPYATAAMAVGFIVVIAGLAYVIRRAHESDQTVLIPHDVVPVST
jgi:lysozyme family protein